MFDLPDFDAHEALHQFHDAATGLRYIVAIHDTTLGPAIGGCRMWPYADTARALRDALRLSRGMTYKAALAGLPCGGGKSVVVGDPRVHKSPELIAAIGRAVHSLGGRYTISDDVGFSADDVAAVGRFTPFACAPIMPEGGASPATAFGTYQGLLATATHVFGSSALAGRSVAVQGLGAVGTQLCDYLAADGAQLFVADLDPARTDSARRRWQATVLPVDQILASDADILAPCALGAILNETTIAALRCRAVAGAANNQLATSSDGEALRRRGIVYAPDYAINVGGLIDLVHARRGHYSLPAVLDDCRRIFERTLGILEQAASRGVSSNSIADESARRALQAPGQ